MFKVSNLIKIFIGLLLSVLILTQSGLTGLAQAASTACDQTNFAKFILGPNGVNTYAVTRSAMTWPAANTLAKAQNGRLAVITGPAVNSAIFTNFSSNFSTPAVTSYPSKKAWIDLTDPNNIPDWSMPGLPPVISPNRFSWADGTSTYTNWASAQPDGYCTIAELSVNPNHICYGENFAAINSDGMWSDEGDHGSTPLTLPAVIEWPNVTLDCVKPATAISAPVITQLPDSDKGQLWCTDSSKSNLIECVQTADGQQLCPLEKAVCNEITENPTCPSGSTLNTTRDMCQKDPEQVKCVAGYSWDQTIDRCVMLPPCPDGGSYNPITDRCEKLVQNDCPQDYSWDDAAQVCQKPVTCPSGGSYNPDRDRCETPVVWDCPLGYAYNSTVAKCEVAPYCPPQWGYNTTTDRCEKVPDTCPQGYSYNPVLDRCTVSATCTDGGTLNSSSDKCELTAAATCNTAAGWVYNSGSGKCEQAPTCTSPGSYNTTYDLCMTASNGTACPGDYYYSATYATCVRAPICNGGSYNAVNDRCEVSATNSCPDPSYSFNSSSGRCEKNPVCPGTMTYSNVYNTCTLSVTLNCAAGYSYNASRSRCEFQPPTCPGGTSYNLSTNRCEANPTCASGTYSAATNNCVSGGSYPATLSGGQSYPNAVPAKCANLYAGTYTWLPSWGPGCTNGSSFTAYIQGETLRILLGDAQSKNPSILGCPTGAGAVFWYDYETNDTVWACAAFSTAAIGGTYSCPSGGTPSGDTCITSSSSAATCPAESNLDGASDKCIANPTCAGGNFDGTYDVCWTTQTTSCAEGTYDGSSGLCIQAPTCSNGLLDGSTDVCFQATSTGCPFGYTDSGGICIATPSCTFSGTFNGGSMDLCSNAATYLCPAEYTYSDALGGQCFKTADCNGGGLNTATDICETSYTFGCPGTYATVGSLCQKAPDCLGGGSYNPAVNFCDGGTNVCAAGLLDASIDQCWQTAGCAGGALNTGRDKCEAAATPNCGTDNYDPTNAVCYSALTCDSGAYQPLRDRCEATVVRNCGTYSWSSPENKCLQPVTCPTDPTFSLNGTIQLSTDLDRCVSQADHLCTVGEDPQKTAWNSLPVMKCEAVPICIIGVYSPISDGCQIPTCPVGTSSCHQLAGDTTLSDSGQPLTYCSPNSCQSDTSGWTTIDDSDTGGNDKKNDGEHDAAGNCLGQIYLFNGHDMRCRVYDRNGMVNSYAKLIASIVLAATGVGAALGAALAASAGISATVATAIVNTAINTAVNAAIDAATGKFNAQSTLMSMGISAIGQALPSMGEYLKDGLGSSGITNTDAISANINLSAGSLSVDPQFASAVGTSSGFTDLATALQGSGTFLDAAAQQASTPAFYTYLQQMQSVADEYSPAIFQGMLGNYSETKCCYPDKLSAACESSEIQEATEEHNGMCHTVGSYCSSRLLGMCMTNKKTSCCFQSRLARIMHEQGRPQLQSFSSGWGSAQSPICRGFTPEEFQALNFSIMDLTEWEESLQANMTQIAPLVSQFITSVGSNAAQGVQAAPAYRANQ